MSGYLKLRGNTWYVRLQTPTSDTQHSLHTSNKLEAEVRAAQAIAAHKTDILAKRPHFTTTWKHRYTPGQVHTDPDGTGTILATDRELHFMGHNGNLIRTEKNGGPALQLMHDGKPGVMPANWRLYDAFGPAERPTVAEKKPNTDDELIRLYVAENNFAETSQAFRETYQMWELFKKLTDNKSLKNCTRDDGRLLVAHLAQRGDKSGTIKKKVGRLCAACNLAIDEGTLPFNPFSGVAKLGKDKLRRKPFKAEHMTTLFANLDKLSAHDQLLFRVVASTGCRLGEAFQINSEDIEEGCRFTIIGTKTEQSERRVPFPASLSPYLPAKITGPLFSGDSNQASRRLGLWLDNTCGITDPTLVAAHSLRHRAQDQLRRAGCPPEIREQLLGWEKKTVAKSYGEGHPVPVLKQWVDKILPRVEA